MISWHDFYVVLSAMVPLYVAMILSYGSVRWWKIFTPEQCSGINRFVAVFAVPLLSFHFISRNNIYTMNFRFIAADTLQKAIMLFVLSLWANLTSHGSLDWSITLFSLSTLPNTLVMGIPLLIAMYGEYSGGLMVQLIVMQCIVWYTLLLFLFEYRAAKLLIAGRFPLNAASIVSLKVQSDVVSLDGLDFIETDAEIGDDGKLHVTVRNSNASRRSFSLSGVISRPSNLTSAEIYSVSSSFRESNFVHSDIWMGMGRLSNFGNSGTGSVSNFNPAEIYPVKSSSDSRPRPRDLEENSAPAAPVNSPDAGKHMPPTSVMTRLILIMVWRKLIRNPNTYSSILGLIWSLVSYRWKFHMPSIVEQSIKILSDTGLGMAMFSLGIFMALQPKIIPCGKRVATFAMAVRFLIGPAVMAAASIAVGLRGTLLRIAVVQAALPQAIVPFVFAKEYNVHAQILSTAVIFGMLVALPITLLYYILLGL